MAHIRFKPVTLVLLAPCSDQLAKRKRRSYRSIFSRRLGSRFMERAVKGLVDL